jgi:hypothetical protein
MLRSKFGNIDTGDMVGCYSVRFCSDVLFCDWTTYFRPILELDRNCVSAGQLVMVLPDRHAFGQCGCVEGDPKWNICEKKSYKLGKIE